MATSPKQPASPRPASAGRDCAPAAPSVAAGGRAGRGELERGAAAPVHPSALPEIPPFEYTRTRVGRVPPEILRAHRIVAGIGRDHADKAFKMLRTQLVRRMQVSGWRTLAIVSPAPDDGKTLIAVNLAMSIARDVHHTALLVDFDLHRPSVHHCFDDTPPVGIGDHLRGRVPLESVFFNPGVPGMTVLPGTAPLEEPSELLASERVAQLVRELRDRYPGRIVLFDLPPILATDDAMAFLPNVDAVLLVVRDRKHTREQLQRVRRLIEPVPVAGVVMNHVDLRGQPYYYGYY